MVWVAPNANRSTISAYQILIRDDGDGSYAENTSLCDGANSETIMSLYCLIPMTSLRQTLSTYDYAANSLPQFKVRAYNVRGWSSYSDYNSIGATIETEPN